MKTPKSETMTIHTIQIKLYCLMVLEKKPCKQKQAKRRIRTASTISTTSNIENTENMEYYQIRKYALLLMNNDDNRNHITSIK